MMAPFESLEFWVCSINICFQTVLEYIYASNISFFQLKVTKELLNCILLLLLLLLLLACTGPRAFCGPPICHLSTQFVFKQCMQPIVGCVAAVLGFCFLVCSFPLLWFFPSQQLNSHKMGQLQHFLPLLLLLLACPEPRGASVFWPSNLSRSSFSGSAS